MEVKKSQFAQKEEELVKFWEDKEIFKKTLEKKSPKGDFVFFEGPPTANGKPGIHHVIARAFKDLIPRYKTMQGYKVQRKAGWDTHGLPVELQIEKELKISGKKEIEKLKPTVRESIEYFNQLCKESVFKNLEDWQLLSKRIAFWLDYDNAYITYKPEYIESLWWIIKQIWNKGLLYKGFKVVPYCTRCGTSLSSHEVAQGYKEVEENSVYLKFKLKKGQKFDHLKIDDDTYILSWTTTPWTLPGNVALAVGENIDYVMVKFGKENLVIAKSRLNVIDKLNQEYRAEEYFKGSDLVGLEYEPLFPDVIPAETENLRNAFKVYAADFVTVSDGTGVVHTAVMYGEADYELGEKVSLPKFHSVNELGRFNKILAEYNLLDKYVKDNETEKIIIDYLKANNFLLTEEMYKHDYPFCWRCDTPLLYYAKPSWFIEMTKLKKELLDNAEKINWVPEYIKEGRFGEWLEGNKDWAFSRERYWGTPLPIWQCVKCEQTACVGSYEELEKLSGQKLNKNFDPHRPFIDDLELNCQCGGQMKRVPEVIDVWFDSGSMPFAQWHYPFENKNLIDKKEQFPADYISEAIDQTRGWFYTLLAVSTLLEKGTPYKNVICLGHLNDKFGKKMSKSKGNVVDPWYIINKYSSDALRWHLYTLNQPGDAKNFDEKNVDEVVKKVILIWQNSVKFFKLYQDKKVKSSQDSPNILDKWVLAEFNRLINQVSQYLDEYNIIEAGRKIQDFINVFSTWYLRRSRDRFKGNDEKDKKQALATTHYVLLNLSKICAPFMPFLAEEIYQELEGGKESVHLEDWPKAAADLIDSKLIENMETVRKIIEQALAVRAAAVIKVRQPLNKLYITKKSLPEELYFLIKDEVNVKGIELVDNLPEGKNLKIGADQNYKVCLDIELDKNLQLEGNARELIRQINAQRKEMGLSIGDLVEVVYETKSEALKETLAKFGDEIKANTLTKELVEGKGKEELEINGEKIKIEIIK
ncbi:MAG: isoleucine--tRNA ligase [Patescibacteria group bacterium]